MSPAHSSRPSRRPALPAFCSGGGRPPRHVQVSRTSLRSLHRLLLFSLLLQLLTLALLHTRFGRPDTPGLTPRSTAPAVAHPLAPRWSSSPADAPSLAAAAPKPRALVGP